MEITNEGGKDENVFNIQQGVSIMIALRHNKGRTKKLAKIYKTDLFGKRISKFDYLKNNSIDSIMWTEIESRAPSYAFNKTDYVLKSKYEQHIKLNELFQTHGVGITSAHDNLVISDNEDNLLNNVRIFQTFEGTNTSLCKELAIREKPGWNITRARQVLSSEVDLHKFLIPISYRPFDNRLIFYHDSLVWRTVKKIMTHLRHQDNIALDVCKQSATNNDWSLAFVTNNIVDESFVSNRTKERGYAMPLYLYEAPIKLAGDTTLCRPNLDMRLVTKLLSRVGKYEWVNFRQHENNDNNICPQDIFDYVYAILYSPTYRTKFKEYLKTDFPRIPPPINRVNFEDLVRLGNALRKYHLMEDIYNDKLLTTFEISGKNTVEKIAFDTNKVWINNTQHFGNVPKEAWMLYIGGYQPAQKWLKDREGRILTYDDITHYRKIIYVLDQTIEIMKQIDNYISL